MTQAPPTQARGASHDNNFGVLRLLFASLVIVSHAPELTDGNRSRELLTRVFGTLSFGELAVDAFFIISGYLITASVVRSRSLAGYGWRRLLRIAPGFLVSFAVCILIVAPLAGADPRWMSLPGNGLRHELLMALTLRSPNVPGAFQGSFYPALNGSMWTIGYECRCYVAAALLGAAGVYTPRWRPAVLACVAILLLSNAAGAFAGVRSHGEAWVGRPDLSLRFAALFGVGTVYCLYAGRLRLDGRGAAIAGALLFGLMFQPRLAEAAWAVLGGYLIFWSAGKLPVLPLARFANRTDLSYGIYLYGWPVEKLLIWYLPGLSPWVVCAAALTLTPLLAYASWTWVERPALAARWRRRSRPALLQRP